MTKPILYRLFRLGALPKGLLPILRKEGILVCDQGMPGRFIARDVKGPAIRYIRRTEGFLGSLVITRKRILGFSYAKRQINLSVSDPKLSRLYVELPAEHRLSLSFESGDFRQGWQGVVEFVFKTEQAERFARTLLSLGATPGRAP